MGVGGGENTETVSVIFGFVLESLLYITNALGPKFVFLSFRLRNNNELVLIIH